jgi:hypothetical protein
MAEATPLDLQYAEQMRAFFMWADAIQAAAAELGVEVRVYPAESWGSPNTGLVVSLIYGWCALNPDHEDHWNIAHKAMVVAEPLRPKFVCPSPALRGFLSEYTQ